MVDGISLRFCYFVGNFFFKLGETEVLDLCRMHMFGIYSGSLLCYSKSSFLNYALNPFHASGKLSGHYNFCL